MFSHITIGSNDLARTKAFYDAPFAATGGEPGFEDAKRRLIYAHRGGRPIVTKPVDGKPATGANGGISVEDPGLSARAPPAGCTSRTCAIRTATSSARSTVYRTDAAGGYTVRSTTRPWPAGAGGTTEAAVSASRVATPFCASFC